MSEPLKNKRHLSIGCDCSEEAYNHFSFEDVVSAVQWLKEKIRYKWEIGDSDMNDDDYCLLIDEAFGDAVKEKQK